MKHFLLKQITDIKIRGFTELIKKINITLKLLLNFPLYVAAILTCIAIRILKPFILIRIDRAPPHYGDFALWTSVYYSKKKLGFDQPKQKYVDLIYINFNNKALNKQLLKMWKRKILFFPKILLDPIYKINRLIPGWENYIIKNLSSRPYYGYKQTPKRKEDDVEHLLEKVNPLSFTEQEENLGKSMLKKFGLNKNDKFVCFAVRDSSFSEVKAPSTYVDWSYHSYRNYDLENFKLAAEELAARGYYVFRVGVTANKPFNLNNKKIIDYANSKMRSDFLDVYLGAKCLFCLSTGYGFDDVSYVFRKPLALMNTPVIGFRSRSDNQIFLTKHHICKKDNNKKLALSEIFSKGVADAYDARIFDQRGVQLKDNTPEEIKDLVLEMLEKINNNNLKNNRTELQKKFQEKFIFHLKQLYKNYPEDFDGNYFQNLRGQFSNKFLEKNRNWLN